MFFPVWCFFVSLTLPLDVVDVKMGLIIAFVYTHKKKTLYFVKA